jgi:homoserine acetyltransferase
VDFELYRAGDVRLQRGDLLEGATLADKSYGELAADKSNLILLLTPFGGDNVELQRRLINEVFHADRVKLALGWSMGGQATTSPIPRTRTLSIGPSPGFSNMGLIEHLII